MSPLLIVLLVGLAAAQPHHGDMSGPLCYDCGGHGLGHAFPECLNHAKNCHGDEVCQFKYGAHTEVKCHKAHDCNREITESGRQCASGGYEVHGSCQTCCADDACSTDIAQKISTMTNTNTNVLGVHCPATCTLDNLATCVSTGHICNGQQYCKVSVDEANGNMHGKCEDVRDLQHCKDEAAAGHCDHKHHNCIMGCCQDDQCVAGSLGATTTSLYEFLKGDCQDQLVGSQCANLDSSQHLCSDRLAVRVCPQTCGLCSLFQTISCNDAVANDGCKDLVVSEDICNNPLGKSICPATCNMCDAILEEKINMMLQNPNPTDSTASIVPPDFGALACGDLANQGCAVLDAVCPTLNCSDVCSKCQTTVMAVATTAVPDGGLNALQCSDLAGLGCGVLDALCSKVNCPDVCDPCFNPIVTVTDMPATTGAPAVDMTTGAPAVDMTSGVPAVDMTTGAPAVDMTSGVPAVDMTTGSVLSGNDTMMATNSPISVCEDTIQDMMCSDVADVCSSPLLVSYCQKYCGLCV